MKPSKMQLRIPVVLTVEATSKSQAEEYVDRLLRHGFESLTEYEQETYKAIKGWEWGN